MFENNEFRRFCNDFTALSEKNLIFSEFVSATRDITPYFIKLKKLHTVSLRQSINTKKCMILSGKLISYDYNSENLDTTVDNFHKFQQISMTQRS